MILFKNKKFGFLFIIVIILFIILKKNYENFTQTKIEHNFHYDKKKN